MLIKCIRLVYSKNAIIWSVYFIAIQRTIFCQMTGCIKCIFNMSNQSGNWTSTTHFILCIITHNRCWCRQTSKKQLYMSMFKSLHEPMCCTQRQAIYVCYFKLMPLTAWFHTRPLSNSLLILSVLLSEITVQNYCLLWRI